MLDQIKESLKRQLKTISKSTEPVDEIEETLVIGIGEDIESDYTTIRVTKNTEEFTIELIGSILLPLTDASISDSDYAEYLKSVQSKAKLIEKHNDTTECIVDETEPRMITVVCTKHKTIGKDQIKNLDLMVIDQFIKDLHSELNRDLAEF